MRVWTPSPANVERANLTRFMRQVRALGERTASVIDFNSLYEWSIHDIELFWSEVWRFCGVVTPANEPSEVCERVLIGRERVAPPDPVLGPRWFVGSKLNFAENLLRFRDDREALVAWNEHGAQQRLTYRELFDAVARLASSLRGMGLRAGDRVAGFLPNLPETVIAMLATASIGAIWSSCSPDFGVDGVFDRFGQIQPRVLFCTDAYHYGGHTIDCLDRVREIAARIPVIERVVVIPYAGRNDVASRVSTIGGASLWTEHVHSRGDVPALVFEQLPFDHPLYIMYSSGTTGLPKCMVHGAGGTLLQHLKELVLHTDLVRDDRIFYFTTCGWMMWNWLVSSLAVGATLVLYDGAPFAAPPADSLGYGGGGACHGVRYEREVAGADRKRQACARSRRTIFGALASVLSTGSPARGAQLRLCVPRRQAGRALEQHQRRDGHHLVLCARQSDRSRTSRRTADTRVRHARRSVRRCGRAGDGQPGELVCTAPFPSMPVRFWNDADGSEVSRRLLRALPEHVAARRLGRADGARRRW